MGSFENASCGRWYNALLKMPTKSTEQHKLKNDKQNKFTYGNFQVTFKAVESLANYVNLFVSRNKKKVSFVTEL